ncbi:MAG TPA: hypothetical protein VMV22_04100 [Acidimicrobiales bacterium]|nr:hypothetical protein [Acidimicrobiales bacterium]
MRAPGADQASPAVSRAAPSPPGGDSAGAPSASAAAAAPGTRGGSARPGLWWGLRAAVLPWVVARVVVVAALVLARQVVDRTHASASATARAHQGLLGWDAGWYESIARHGYAGAGHAALRFFPVVPLLVRALASLPGVGIGAALLVVANASALVAVALLAALARRETGDDALARRAAWLACLAPPAFTAVMGYAEGTLMALGVGMLLALRARAWWWAAGLGLVAGATRPLGVMLVVPAVVETVRGLRGAPVAERVARAAAVVGPAAGLAAFLGWVGWRYGDALAPLRVQQQGTLRGRLADPVRTLAHDTSLLAHGRHLGSALHLPWALLALGLVVVALRHWPASFGALAAAVLVVALTASNLDGFERYALSAFPLVLAGATVTAGERMERAVLVLAGAGLVVYAVLAFTDLYVP